MPFVIQGLSFFLSFSLILNLGKRSSYKEVHISENFAKDSFALLECFTSFQFTSRSLCLKVSIELLEQLHLYINSSLASVLSITHLNMKNMEK